ncbi:hypothetical protein KP509_01G100300 [Ceratopteris richardii]|uniref:Tetraspanin-8 n=2 Tax=Ceratopteris richardii TaxID=49495 RepID=A0A8T2VP13_CERRI|nr:hypothetical protein KP509_01G099600 [Ceratopteris richardii]KAH7447285.1 hypothetical protein KP509_01G100300 [Ceratopteris richardii]
MGVSNNVIGILNFLTAVLSIPMIGAGIWLASKHSTDCMRFLQWPVIIIGVFILLVSLAGLIGSCYRSSCLLWIYATIMFLLILLLFCFTVFAFVVTNKGAGDAVSGKGFDEFHLGNYSSWLQRQVNKASVWRKIQSCLADSNTCSKLNSKYTTVEEFNAAHLSPIQSGCCKPPSACGYTFVTPTNWTTAAIAAADNDCTLWNNDAKQLCYSCDSCKAGVLQNVKKDWRKVGVVNVIMLVFLIVVYSVSCCAIRSVKREKYYGYA